MFVFPAVIVIPKQNIFKQSECCKYYWYVFVWHFYHSTNVMVW